MNSARAWRKCHLGVADQGGDRTRDAGVTEVSPACREIRSGGWLSASDCSYTTRTMLIKVDPGSSEPLFVQIAAQVRNAIARGAVVEGDRLPAARELAEALGVNMHTVLRAYGDLRDEGLVDMRRRRGVIVLAAGDQRARLLELARELTAEATRQGLTKTELRRLVEEVG